ncbi:MAG TPA: patatin-like phospholipase family protein [Ideonella sp.]|nr:patatin-like phospholipase family protein [Ideonella sp.]
MRRPRGASRIGLALAGGGPLGAIYEIGALCALEEALPGLDFTALDAYLGVSAGGFIAAGLANGLSPRQLCEAFIENRESDDVLHPSLFVRPAWGEFAQRLASLPGLVAQTGWRAAWGRESLLSALERLGRALPAGVFSTAQLEAHLQRIFSAPGRSNDFRALSRRLVLVATDLDTGEAAPFGLPGWDDVPISRAVAASAALPGLFPPVEIKGRHYADGALKKTLHASVLLDEGMDLLLCLNPLVPFHSTQGMRRGVGAGAIPRLTEGGLPLLLSQTLRSLIHSRLALGLQGYARSHPDADVLLFEPEHHDTELFLANTFSYGGRRRLAEHAYQSTRQMLRTRRSLLRPQLARHGVALNDEVLDDPARRLLGPAEEAAAARPARAARRTLRQLDQTLDELEAVLALQAPPRARRGRRPAAQPR